MEPRDAQMPEGSPASWDAATLGRVWATHRRWVAAVLLAHRPPKADLEDLLQDVALAMVRRIRELRDARSLRPWLRQVALNAARDLGRKRKVRDRVHAPMPTPEDAPIVPFDGAARDRMEAVLRIVFDLPPNLREPLLLRTVDGMSQRAVAETLGVPETTIETRLARARRALRDRLARTSDTPATFLRRAGGNGARP